MKIREISEKNWRLLERRIDGVLTVGFPAAYLPPEEAVNFAAWIMYLCEADGFTLDDLEKIIERIRTSELTPLLDRDGKTM